MKRVLLAVIASAGLIVSVSALAQDWSGPEVGIQGGYGWGSSNGTTVDTTGAAGPYPYSFSPSGGMGGVHAGFNWQFGQIVLGLDTDAEGGTISGGQTVIVGGVPAHMHSNLDFDASVRGKLGWSFGRIMPYATGGVAFGDVNTRYNVGGVPEGTAGGVRVGWTAGGGLDYALTPNWSLAGEYRYTDLGRRSESEGGFTDANEFHYNIIRAVLTYRFAPPPPPPPMMAAPMPAAAPAPAPPPPNRTFLVFFDFDRYNLAEDARHVIDAAVANYKATGSARIDVSGYTDLSGTQAYNMRLSQRRADAVAAYLVHQGVPKNVMDVKWFGKDHPRVPTPDGVREPQNRRVEIVMQQ
jgi:OmpA-OmpF porin, OOP family